MRCYERVHTAVIRYEIDNKESPPLILISYYMDRLTHSCLLRVEQYIHKGAGRSGKLHMPTCSALRNANRNLTLFSGAALTYSKAELSPLMA
jgi:hypothetical protein